ncbi:hypothetical protein AB0J38_06730 [Streptomyces sp. NPDC050095]|uniref:hypothetical protein n=1 Tax=unclassified Streptomyces TaxID=2593676 RepID=UPI003444BAB0
MTPAVRAIARAALAARPLSLTELDARAGLLTRHDRAYLVPYEVFQDVATLLTDPRRAGGALRALSVNGRRWFAYRTTYYDTADLRAFHDRRRTVRERLYADTGERRLEIALRGTRGETVTHRRRLASGEQVLDAAGAFGRACGVAVPEGLRPVLVVEHGRATFVADGERVTCDAEVVVRDVGDEGREVRGDGGLVRVGSKGRLPVGEADRVLGRFGVGAVEGGEYGRGVAAVRPELAGLAP